MNVIAATFYILGQYVIIKSSSAWAVPNVCVGGKWPCVGGIPLFTWIAGL